MKRLLVIFFLGAFSIFCPPLFSQSKPRIAVIPFNPAGVSEQESRVLTELFETGLVNTDVFQVIEQNRVKEIVEAQKYSLEGCTDEACAVEFGRLLAADRIILGTVSVLGSRFIITAKIINVQSGENLKADKVTAESLEGLTDKAELLAFKLAGITYAEDTEGQTETSEEPTMTDGKQIKTAQEPTAAAETEERKKPARERPSVGGGGAAGVRRIFLEVQTGGGTFGSAGVNFASPDRRMQFGLLAGVSSVQWQRATFSSTARFSFYFLPGTFSPCVSVAALVNTDFSQFWLALGASVGFEIRFKKIVSAVFMENTLALNTVPWEGLPLVYLPSVGVRF